MLLREYKICHISELLHETIMNMAVDVIIYQKFVTTKL